MYWRKRERDFEDIFETDTRPVERFRIEYVGMFMRGGIPILLTGIRRVSRVGWSKNKGRGIGRHLKECVVVELMAVICPMIIKVWQKVVLSSL